MSTSARIKEKVDERIIERIEKGIKRNHRVIIGVEGKVSEVIHHIHALLARYIIRPRLLWVYKKNLDVKEEKVIKAKKRKSAGDSTLTNFESFLVNTEITYVLHDECERILGTTTEICVFQDFEEIKANTLASIIESVRGGGIIILPVKQTDSLYMERMYKLLFSSNGYMEINEAMNILHISQEPSEEKENIENSQLNRAVEIAVEKVEKEKNPLNPLSIINTNSISVLIKQCKTGNQVEALLKMAKVLEKRTTVAVTAERGRGKSAALGLAIALAVIKGMNDILVTSPHLSNVQTLFSFLIQGLIANGYNDQIDYHVAYSQKNKREIEKITVTKTHHQSISFTLPNKLAYSPSLLVVDEAAAIPLTILKQMMGTYPTLLSSTTAGYEGTGRALSLKFFKTIKPECVSLEEPIRYGRHDPVEKWLNVSLSLSPEIPKMITFPKEEKCKIFSLNKSILFSGAKETEEILASLTSILLSGHYKNSPNDLQIIADNPRHSLLSLISEDGKVLGLMQVSEEGSTSSTSQAYREMRGEEGNLIPWSLAHYYLDMDIFKLSGLRIVRIAIHPDAQSMGYGSYFVSSLISSIGNIQNSIIDSSVQVLFSPLTLPAYDYLGVSFGLTESLLGFWKKQNMRSVYLKHSQCKSTGEHSLIMIKGFTEQANMRFTELSLEFSKRFIELLPGCFKEIPGRISVQLIQPVKPNHLPLPESHLHRMEQFSKCNLDIRIIQDILPSIAKDLLLTEKDSVSLTQKIIILLLGLQHKKPQEAEKELSLPSSQLRMLLAKAMFSLSGKLKNH
ncbi:N-acetyltransferase 10 [Nematocida sp. LUAm3]|nr:N-acetyltransferase 10 [Nematocida sp. LUAm3]